MSLRFLLFFVFALLLDSCATKQDSGLEAGIYYWKTNWDFTAQDQRRADSMQLKTLYLRLMDVDWSEGYQDAVPVAEMRAFSYWSLRPPTQKLVPVVYITQRTWTELTEQQVNQLATRLARRLIKFKDHWDQTVVTQRAQAISKDSLGNYDYQLYEASEEKIKSTFNFKRPVEVQIDSDWTPGTRAAYFRFLELLKKQLPAHFTLSCTVRLHQFRDREKNGIPPVDRGMMMVYNVADPTQKNTQNAIFDASLIKGYLKGNQYPIPLDWALPLFSWSVWFQQDRFMALINDLEKEVVQKNPWTFQHQEGNRYTLLKDTVIGPHYLREGDWIRVESPDITALEQVTEHIRTQFRPDQCTIAFFDWHHIKDHSEYEKNIQRCMARLR